MITVDHLISLAIFVSEHPDSVRGEAPSSYFLNAGGVSLDSATIYESRSGDVLNITYDYSTSEWRVFAQVKIEFSGSIMFVDVIDVMGDDEALERDMVVLAMQGAFQT
jgi:hypothetical protein